MPNPSTLTLAALSLALVGCAKISPSPLFSRPNPADPHAGNVGFPPAVPVLMVGTNYTMGPQTEAQPIGMKMSMPEHGAQPMKMPQHDGHDKTSDKPAQHDHHESNPPKQ
jgi:hypothetical protein